MHVWLFILNIPAKREKPHLETIIQSKGKSLRDYMARFNMEALKISHLEDFRVIEAIASRRKLSNHMMNPQSPFFEVVRKEPMPSEFKLLTLPTYDGATNPKDYVLKFQAVIEFYTRSEVYLEYPS